MTLCPCSLANYRTGPVQRVTYFLPEDTHPALLFVTYFYVLPDNDQADP